MSNVTVELIKALREKTNAGVMDCRNALTETGGDVEKAAALLTERGMAKALKKADRATGQGRVEAYVHPGNRLAAVVEVNCETDFVARTDQFIELAHNLAMQVAAMNPKYLRKEDLPSGETAAAEEVCLLHQAFIKDPSRTVDDLVRQTIAQVGENIRVRRFARFALGE